MSTLAIMVSRDIGTTTGANLRYIKDSSGLSPWETSQEKLREAIIEKETVTVQDMDKWRIPLLDKLLATRQNMEYMGEEENEVSRMTDLIDSLCIN